MSLDENKPSILILGGYGTFGSLIATHLAKEGLNIIIAGRSLEKATLFVKKLKQNHPNASLQAAALDWQETTFDQKLQQCQPELLIHCAGPFLHQNYKVAQTCLDLNIHYIDLADGREFVTNMAQLDQKAKENNICIISGAGTLPGLSCAVVDAFAKKFAILREIEFGVAPANKIHLGKASITSILSDIGKPFLRLAQGIWKKVYGWQNLHRHYYGDNLGLRWQANGDIPDLALLPLRYTTLATVNFHTGLEIPFLHILFWLMSWLSRAKIVKNWASFYKLMTLISRYFYGLGTQKSGMYVRLSGSSMRYQPLEINWILVAEKNHGIYLPIIPCLILVKKMIQGLITPGAQACVGLFSLDEIENWLGQWRIYTTVEEVEI